MRVNAASLIPMSNAELLEYIKNAGGVSAALPDKNIQPYVDSTKFYLQTSGVDELVLNSTLAASIISRGTLDAWNYGNGDSEYSPMFYELAEKLRCIERVDE